MSSRRLGYGVLAVALIAALSLFAVGSASTAVKKCRASQVRMTVAGQRTCVSRARFRPAAVPRSQMTAAVADFLSRPIVVTRRSNRRRVVLRSVSPVLARRATATTAELEVMATAAVRRALQPATSARAGARTHADAGVTISRGGDGSVSGRVSQTVSSGGDSATVTVNLAGRNVGGEAVIDVGVDVTVTTNGGVTVGAGFTIKDITRSPGVATCPTADGKIRLDDRWGGAARKSEKFGNLGTFRSAASVDGSVKSTAQMGPDAKLVPFPFTVTSRFDVAVSTQALAFIDRRSRAVATGSLSGTIDPASGQISGGAASVNVTVTGLTGNDAVAMRASLRIEMEKTLRNTAGGILKSAKDVEQRAQSGKCTRLIFDPATPGTLAPNGAVTVSSRLEAVNGGGPVTKVKWTASATKGAVSPANSTAERPSWSITGAATGPETAHIPVRAVSPAGISETPWVGQLAFPPSYSGTVSLSRDLGGQVETWTGSFTWTRTSVQEGANRSQIARYTLVSSSVAPYNARVPSVSGFCTGGRTAPSGTVVFGDLEINLDAGGAWTSAFVVDVDVDDFAITCPPGDPPFSGLYPAKSFLNSRQMPGSQLRPMPAAGVIAATAVADVGLPGVMLSTASWNLQPGS